jgi:hypothetical protein
MTPFRFFSRALPAILAVTLCVGATPRLALGDSTTFILQDLVFTGAAGQNNWTPPLYISEPGIDGHLLWTYTPGDFANGTGVLEDLTLPITYFPFASAVLTVDATGITGTQTVNTQNLTYDFQINFTPSLTSPTQGASINPATSTFNFTGYYTPAPSVILNGEWLGNISGGTIVPASWVLSVDPVTPALTALFAPSPNPSRGATALGYSLARPGRVHLSVLAVDGRQVTALVDAERSAGVHRLEWDGRDGGGRPVSPGLYYARLVTPDGSFTRRVVRLE